MPALGFTLGLAHVDDQLAEFSEVSAFCLLCEITTLLTFEEVYLRRSHQRAQARERSAQREKIDG